MAKSFLDENEFRAKKVFKKFENKQKSTYSFNKKKDLNFSTYQNSNNTNFNKSSYYVVSKITSSSKNQESLKQHLKYISRNGEVELESSDGEIFRGKEDFKNLFYSYNVGYKIPTKIEINNLGIKEKRETFNFVFSMKDYENASIEDIKKASINTFKKVYPNNYFVIAKHTDTDNPHCHICLKAVDDFGKRINPKKSDLAKIREIFAYELQNMDIKAYAKSTKNLKEEFNEYKKNINENHHYNEVLAFGEAHYKFDPKKDMSFFVKYKTFNDKEVEIWGKDLKDVFLQNNIYIGDKIKLGVVGQQENYCLIEEKNNEFFQKIVYKNLWDVSIKNKDEKQLHIIKKKLSKYTYVGKCFDEIADIGRANKNFDSNKKECFYVKLKKINDKYIYIFDDKLENLCQKYNLKVGSKCIIDKNTLNLTIPKEQELINQEIILKNRFQKLYEREL